MIGKCFVPNCKNTTGIAFPEQDELKQKWLESLKIQVEPDAHSIVCLDHFDATDIELNDADNENDEKINKTLSFHVKNGAIPYLKKKLEGENDPIVKHETNADAKENKEKEEIDENCRLCGAVDVSNSIFDKLEENVGITIITAIKVCLQPIKVCESDPFPKRICSTCLISLRASYKFKIACLATDEKRRKELEEEESRKRRLSDNSDEDTNEINNKMKRRFSSIIYDEYNGLWNDFFSKKTKVDSASKKVSENKSISSLPDSPKEINSDLPLPLSLLKLNTDKQIVGKKLDLDKKFDKVQEELRRVLEGKLTEEQIDAENIIIAVTSDDECDDGKEVVLPVKEDFDKSLIKIVKIKNEPDSASNTSTSVKITASNNEEVILPKGIRVTVPEKYESNIGVFPSTLKKYVFDSQFCLVDGYLLEFRLEKGNVRYLRCINTTCHCMAIQNKMQRDDFTSDVILQTPHNHKIPTNVEMRKQMFYHIIRKKMQADKSLNFRHVYEEICKYDPKIRELIPLRNVINEMCRHQLTFRCPKITSFEDFYEHIEEDQFQKLHYTHTGKQFYQERFSTDDETKAIVFANCDVIKEVSDSKLMYVDASFKIDTNEDFKYQLVTILVWIDESYYPIVFALVSRKTQEIYKKIFEYLHDVIAPKLRPEEIVTDYEANLYYALGETYLDSHIGGSVFYYTQNLYKKICTLNLSRDLETNSYFRNIYHMLLMLPLLPVNTVLDGLNNIEVQSRDLGLTELTRPIFDHVRSQWIIKVTPDLFCVHRLENRINENVIAPFKKLRDFLMLSKGKLQKNSPTIVHVVEKLIELDAFLQLTYSAPSKKSFARDLSCSQKKNVLKAWQFIESHPKININHFFTKVLGYIKCMENQLWIWGFYRYAGDVTDDLINATNFSIVSNDEEVVTTVNDVVDVDEEMDEEQEVEEDDEVIEGGYETVSSGQAMVMDAVIDENGEFVIKNNSNVQPGQFENAFLKYVYKE